MARSYTHSSTFGSLKKIEEGISHNLTSYQYLQTLDWLLDRAVSLIYLSSPSFVKNYAAKVVAHQTLKPATKFSRNERGTLPHILFNFLVFGQLAHFNALNLNRGLLFGLVTEFLKTVNCYKAIHSCQVPATVTDVVRVETLTRQSLGFGDRYNLYSIIKEVEYWDSKARWFKSLIVQKYVRMALLQAQSLYKELAHSVPLDDISQIYLLYVSKAIDRCDSRQGVLTTFIQSWLKSAKAESAALAKENFHRSYDEMVEEGDYSETVLPDTTYEVMQHLAAVAKQHDKEGYVRASLGIPEFVTPKHRSILLTFIPE